MQRWCSKLRSLAALHKPQPTICYSATSSHRLLHTCSNFHYKPLTSPLVSPHINSLLRRPSLSALSPHFNNSSRLIPTSFVQVRHITAKQRKKKLKSRKPPTPVVSKVKKIKMKGYSSFKGRFRVMNDGQIRRWKEGKRHNAHLKSKEAKRRLRRPGTVPLAYAKVMKRLNFCG